MSDRITLTRVAFRVKAVREHGEGDSYEITLARDDKQSTIYLDDAAAASGISVGSIIEVTLAAIV